MVESQDKIGVLHLEDDRGIREAVRFKLKPKGYDIIAQPEKLAELKTILSDNNLLEQIAIAIIDGGLPDGSGKEAMELIRAVRPDMPIIALAGQPETFGNINMLKTDANTQLLPALEQLLHPTKQ